VRTSRCSISGVPRLTAALALARGDGRYTKLLRSLAPGSAAGAGAVRVAASARM
jgi:hypothetical protein